MLVGSAEKMEKPSDKASEAESFTRKRTVFQQLGKARQTMPHVIVTEIRLERRTRTLVHDLMTLPCICGHVKL